EKLDLDGDNATVALRWEQWKRSFNIYLEATGISGEEKKRATLLLLGGPGIQEIVFNLPGAYEENSTTEAGVFKTVIEKLDDYFLPKQNKIYERHLFRQIKQVEGEKFEKFVVKLRNQSSKCKFTSPDEHIIDQIVEKCFSPELRKKILTLGDTVTLDKIITEANTLEIVNQQLEEYGQNSKPNDVNTIRSYKKNYSEKTDDVKRKNEIKKLESTTKSDMSKCGRCGYDKHIAPNEECPAKRRNCNACGKSGHFSAMCKSKPEKRKREDKPNNNSKIKKKRNEVNLINVRNDSSEEDHYVFNMNDDDEANIECEMGGVKVNLLIDSGCKLNLITEKTWEDVLVEIPVDEKCKPVSQPYRRIPIPIENKVEKENKRTP
ncbi:uncharacterized protein LOC113507064, partial [Trichoplusia ni]|uniref:Uncharacterized protein LOC113507064 n=1 Tax=Trichoplusia ni TaxID=7111 RepID=A0A7E5WZQ6_TRINI